MPTATAFNALGAGNGFAECISKVDVSGYDKWQTLGGFKDTDSGSPSDAQLLLSLENAMRFYWNLYGLNPSARSLDDNNSIDIEAGSPSSSPTTIVTVTAGAPNTRVCGTDVTANPKVYNLPYSDSNTSGNYSATVDVDINIVKMYDGSTSNDSNYRGYGITAASNSPAIQCEAKNDPPAQGGMGSRLFINSYINDISGGFDNHTLTDYVNVSYGSGGSMPLVIAMAVGTNAITISGYTLATNPPRAYVFNNVNDLYAMETQFHEFDLYSY